jgi:dihydropteroate synthase
VERLYANLGGIDVGDEFPVRIVGAINVSPESFYTGSVSRSEDALRRKGAQMAAEGADLLDIGARSTAPYLETEISEEEEVRRITWAVRAVREAVSVPIAADTTRARVARAALEAGADIVNDVSGLHQDPGMGETVARFGQGLILMAPGGGPVVADPIDEVRGRLAAGLEAARKVGLAPERIVVDPGIGFFRHAAVPWYEWDSRILTGLAGLQELGRPILVGVSRKSFIGELLGRGRPEDRLEGSLAATAIAVYNGAHLVRTHDVAATREVARMAEALRRFR